MQYQDNPQGRKGHTNFDAHGCLQMTHQVGCLSWRVSHGIAKARHYNGVLYRQLGTWLKSMDTEFSHVIEDKQNEPRLRKTQTAGK